MRTSPSIFHWVSASYAADITEIMTISRNAPVIDSAYLAERPSPFPVPVISYPPLSCNAAHQSPSLSRKYCRYVLFSYVVHIFTDIPSTMSTSFPWVSVRWSSSN